jgi:hypothetical protein
MRKGIAVAMAGMWLSAVSIAAAGSGSEVARATAGFDLGAAAEVAGPTVDAQTALGDEGLTPPEVETMDLDSSTDTSCTIDFVGDYDWRPTWNIQETWMGYHCSGTHLAGVTTQMEIYAWPQGSYWSNVFSGNPSSYSGSNYPGWDEFDVGWGQPGCWAGHAIVTWDLTEPICSCWWWCTCYWSMQTDAWGPEVCN